MLQRFLALLAAPGAKDDIQDAAPTEPTLPWAGRKPSVVTTSPTTPEEDTKKSASTTSVHEQEASKDSASGASRAGSTTPPAAPTTPALTTLGHPPSNPLDRALDRLVAASGSQPVFLLIVTGLLLWALLGIPYGQDPDWQVGISDAQALISYFFDSLLMRQLLNGYSRQIRVTAALRSRGVSVRRMLREVQAGVWKGRVRCVEAGLAREGQELEGGKEVVGSRQKEFATELPAEDWLGRASTLTSKIFGHLVTICLYWVCIFVWLGLGPYCGWSNEWQLYINSATSALMVLIFAFLANIRERHDSYTAGCLAQIFAVDSAVERRLRSITGDSAPNPVVTVPAPRVGRLQRAIFYYADVVGTLVGVALLIIVVVVWLAIGPALQFDANWWLVIGTYAGLIGLNDGFVLRNVQAKFIDYENDAFEALRLDDMDLAVSFADLDDTTTKVQAIANEKSADVEAVASTEQQSPSLAATARKQSLTDWLSIKMGIICAHQYTVLVGVLFIVGLLVGATVMGWSETGQLICNIPPSIIESFFMMILLTGHNLADAQRREDLNAIYERRLKLWEVVGRVEPVC